MVEIALGTALAAIGAGVAIGFAGLGSGLGQGMAAAGSVGAVAEDNDKVWQQLPLLVLSLKILTCLLEVLSSLHYQKLKLFTVS